MKKLIFAALASAAACLCVAFAACTETAPGGIEYTVEVSNNIIVAFVAPQSVDEKNLSVKDYFDGLVEAGKLTYEISDGMVESINGQSNSAATMSYCMFYSGLVELDGVAYTLPSHTYHHNGKELGRRQIWAELKRLCKYAGVEPEKVFPHNLRHLFATVFYRTCRDIAKLADLLGHSSIETTRIYLVSSGVEHQREIDRLGLVL